MIAVAAHTDSRIRAEIADVLRASGWTVQVTDDADQAIAACRATEADVLLIGRELSGGVTDLLERVKRDAELFRTAVVLLGADLDAAEVLEWLQRGADDVLLTPPDPADVVGRAFAAARTKALVKELTAQNDRLEELVFFDDLTGLRNRRALLHELDMLLAGARRHGHDLSVLMLDIDRFKAINDRFGHRAGDDVLREVSRRLLARLRSADVAGRLGGDELLIALADTGADGAAVLAESIRAAVADGPIETSAGPIDVTISVGSAAWVDEDLGGLLERADGALYAAKAAGRDRSAAA
jgi:two-component system cell cycle response regulator